RRPLGHLAPPSVLARSGLGGGKRRPESDERRRLPPDGPRPRAADDLALQPHAKQRPSRRPGPREREHRAGGAGRSAVPERGERKRQPPARLWCRGAGADRGDTRTPRLRDDKIEMPPVTGAAVGPTALRDRL